MSMPEDQKFWLVKFAPFRTSWAEVVKRGTFTMRGVRNPAARNNLAAMRTGDQVFFYHSQQELAVMGLCEVYQQAFPDPTSADPQWLAVALKPTVTLANPVPLSRIKTIPELRHFGLIRQPRLSVMPVTEPEFHTILVLSAQGYAGAELDRKCLRDNCHAVL